MDAAQPLVQRVLTPARSNPERFEIPAILAVVLLRELRQHVDQSGWGRRLLADLVGGRHARRVLEHDRDFTPDVR